MIVTELYNGQGLGNQLWCYITTRVIAKDRGYDFGIKSPEKFKGSDFLNLDFGKEVIGGDGPEGEMPRTLPGGIINHYVERKIIHPLNGSDIRVYDENLIHIQDNTKIDGCMQDEQYILHRKDEIREWLKVKEEYECTDFSSDDICVINFRGGGYVNDKDFFLPQTYWKNAVHNMLKINPHFKFVVITEDVVTAQRFFPDFDVFHFSIAKDYIVIKNAHYLILSNSSFAWFPAWLNENLKFCIAPKYWGRHNISDGYWSLGYNITTGWMYQNRKGGLEDYASCLDELTSYVKRHNDLYSGSTAFNPSLETWIKNKMHIGGVLGAETSRLNAFTHLALLSAIDGAKALRDIVKKTVTKPVTGTVSSQEERWIFDALKDKMHIVFDVGVRNELSFYTMKNDCSYHLFEPNSDFTKMLKKQISAFKNPDITLNEYGLSDENRDDCVYYEKSQAFIINPYFKDGDKDTGRKFSLRTLDRYVNEHRIPHIDFLKIDAEGLDYKIIIGAKETIEKNKVSFIQFEYWDGVKKFVQVLNKNFNLYLIMEPRLLRAITNIAGTDITMGQQDYSS
jgi:FkbM family methyltransferase